MADLIPPTQLASIVDLVGGMKQRFLIWTQGVTNEINFYRQATGTGSPQGVVSAKAGKMYNNTAAIELWWKSVDNVAGDPTMGWVKIS